MNDQVTFESEVRLLFHKGTQYCIETDSVSGKLNLRYNTIWQWKQHTYNLFEVFLEYC